MLKGLKLTDTLKGKTVSKTIRSLSSGQHLIVFDDDTFATFGIKTDAYDTTIIERQELDMIEFGIRTLVLNGVLTDEEANTICGSLTDEEANEICETLL